MIEHFFFLFYIFLFIFSTIGHGEIFARIFNRELLSFNIGYKGLIGFFSISLISLLSSYFLAHNFLHNFILQIFGIYGFILFLKSDQKNLSDLSNFIILLLILLVGSYVYKNHDDFPYYHLTYALNLSENRFIIGTGIFSHGFRTFSSLFYYHSTLYFPYIKFYLFHIGPFFILVFFNFIILKDLFNKIKEKKVNFLYYFNILALIFVNIAFYRIGEHGTDRSAQILLLLIFSIFFDLIFFEKKEKNVFIKINLILILIFMASSMKAIYYLYLLLVPIILISRNYVLKFFNKKNILIILILSISLTGNLVTNYFNTGCFLYPAEKTCIGKTPWSIPKKHVKQMKLHYEWWSKAGNTSEMKREKYVSNFNWLDNWIDRHFFNKVSDTLFGIMFICLVVYLSFRMSSLNIKSKNNDNVNLIVAITIPLIFLIEWFLNHPAMRYGGYVLVALPLFILTSYQIQKLNINKKKIVSLTTIFVFIAISGYVGRNLIRLNKEINFYKYDIINSPYFRVENVKSIKILDSDTFKVYSVPEDKMCWAAKTPCSYSRFIESQKFLGFNVVRRNEKHW